MSWFAEILCQDQKSFGWAKYLHKATLGLEAAENAVRILLVRRNPKVKVSWIVHVSDQGRYQNSWRMKSRKYSHTATWCSAVQLFVACCYHTIQRTIQFREHFHLVHVFVMLWLCLCFRAIRVLSGDLPTSTKANCKTSKDVERPKSPEKDSPNGRWAAMKCHCRCFVLIEIDLM